MPMRFLLDENISPEVAIICRRFGLDAVHLQEVLAKGADDAAVLAHAAQIGRCVVTADREDFWPLSVRFAAEHLPHAGVLLMARPPTIAEFERVARALAAFAVDYPDGVPPYFTAYLSTGQAP